MKGLSIILKSCFNKSLADATANLQGNKPFIDKFFEAFESNSKGTVKLASQISLRTEVYKVKVVLISNDRLGSKVIRRKVDESVESAFGVLRKRIDKFGVTQPNIQKLGESGQILVELPGLKM
jgi:SecD/SecF fusion protein